MLFDDTLLHSQHYFVIFSSLEWHSIDRGCGRGDRSRVCPPDDREKSKNEEKDNGKYKEKDKNKEKYKRRTRRRTTTGL